MRIKNKDNLKKHNRHIKEGEALEFTLVVPALNEENAIAETLNQALDSSEEIEKKTPINKVYIVFVNDGSTDNTQKIADKFRGIIKIQFKKNKGYGAAIKRGFLETDTPLVGFMDGDGTCHPHFFIELINHLQKSGADVVVGSRLNPRSKMLLIRKFGNKIFAWLLRWISDQKLTDVASGMRVIQRASLNKMMPLPDGLHFTPVMSAVAVLDPRIKIEEVPMSYSQRIGKSKLSVVKDGLRFLYSIFAVSLCYRPLKICFLLGSMLALSGLIVGFSLFITGLHSVVYIFFSGIFIYLSLLVFTTGLIIRQINYSLIKHRYLLEKESNSSQRLQDGMVLIRLGIFTCAVVICFSFIFFLFSFINLLFWIILAALFTTGGLIGSAGVVFRTLWALRLKQKAVMEDSS